jgi:hypothetical protein
MSVSESVQVASQARTTTRPEGLVPLLVVLAIGLAVFVALLAFGTGEAVVHHVGAPHIPR